MHAHTANPHDNDMRGFTLIEMLITVVIGVTLFGLISITLAKPQDTANSSAIIDALFADIKNQQAQAMFGGLGNTTTAQSYGIYVQSNQYVLFDGTTYNAGAGDNFVTTIPSGYTLSTTLPSTQAVFIKGSGEVQGYTAGSNTITLTGSTGNKTITFTRFGALSVN
jgi:prepilin-type N-terminal cleavage/methylation domain-containing protein